MKQLIEVHKTEIGNEITLKQKQNKTKKKSDANPSQNEICNPKSSKHKTS